MKRYRLRGSAAQMADLARQALSIKARTYGDYNENERRECVLRWREHSTEHALSLSAKNGQAILIHEWSERTTTNGPKWWRYEAIPVELQMLDKLHMLQEVNDNGNV